MLILSTFYRADNVLDGWKTIYDISKSIYDSLSSSYKPSFFELVHHPVSASYNLAQLYVAVGKNNLYASQARISTNDLADLVSVAGNCNIQYHLFMLTVLGRNLI
jgi:hypothetical protein